MKLHRIGALCALFATSACSTAKYAAQEEEEARPAPRFPTQTQLSEIASVPLTAPAQPRETLEVESWPLVGPFSSQAALTPHPSDTKIGALLVERAQTKGVETSEAMACVAREVGTFYLEHNKYPAPALESFITGRCGAPVLGVGTNTFGNTDIEKRFTEAELFKAWQNDLEKMIDSKLDRERPAGVWFGRKDKRAYFFLTQGPKESAIEAVVSSTVTAGQFTVRGKILMQATNIRALVNIGEYRTAECWKNNELTLPAFEVTCPADPKDSMAWIEVVAFPPGRIIGPSVGNILVSPNGFPPNAYTRPKYGADNAVADSNGINAHLVPAINRVRAQAALRPLELEAKQSATAAKVAQHYFAAASGRIDPTIADVVVLGVRAGWNISDMIRYGLFTTAASGIGGNIDDLLCSALERPFGREVLLDPNVRKLALGPVWSDEEQYFGAIISTYALFEPEDQQQLKWRVFDALGKQRARGGMGAPALLAPMEEATKAIVAAVESGELTPRRGLQRLIDITAQALPYRTVGGWVFETESIESIEFPKELLKQPLLKATAAVAVHRSADDPWGRYVVLLVYEAAAPVTTTMLDRAHPVFASSP
jgi:hypothetical protein